MSRPFAGVLIIGNEILSGRTQDQNLQYIAQGLTQRGIVLSEVRVIPDDISTVVRTFHDMRPCLDMIITTGGLGGTHDDVTTEAIAQFVLQPLVYHDEAWEMMAQHYGSDLDPLYKKMAYLPQGATLIPNILTGAPGFSIENIHVLAGVPSIMRVMFDALLPQLPQGRPWYTQTLVCHVEEGLIAHDLEELQKLHPDVQIGSYPISLTDHTYCLHLVLKADEASNLAHTLDACQNLIRRYGDEPQLLELAGDSIEV